MPQNQSLNGSGQISSYSTPTPSCAVIVDLSLYSVSPPVNSNVHRL